MDENLIYKTVFETINESTEWGTEQDSKVYGHWVDGVMTFAGDIIRELREINKQQEKLKDITSKVTEKKEN